MYVVGELETQKVFSVSGRRESWHSLYSRECEVGFHTILELLIKIQGF
jgi:hypothetical protein